MRGFVRLLVVAGLLAGAGSLVPVADAVGGPVTTAALSTRSDTTATVTYSADAAGATFACTLTRDGQPVPVDPPCSADLPTEPPADPPATTGSHTFTALSPGAYTFSVAATTADGVPGDAAPDVTWTVTAPPPPPPAATAPTTTIDRRPPNSTTARTVTYAFHADQTGATFACRLTGPGRTGTAYAPCRPTGTTYSGLSVGRYTFAVHATVPGQQAGPDATDAFTVYDNCATLVTKCPLRIPDTYAVPGGATFNNPTGTTASKRRNLTHVIRTINSMPGYRVSSPGRCSNDPARFPGTIRISLYSVADVAFANAMVNASNRCISVQILMNNHLSARNTKAIRILQTGLGSSVFTARGVARRSFAHQCYYGCRGRGVLHSKFYLFNSTLSAPHANRITGTVMVGSSNMTSNAAKVQWNDLFTVRGNPLLHRQFSFMFARMKKDRPERRLYRFTAGPYQSTFWPQTPGTSDPTLNALRSIRCTGVTGGAGINGRSVVYVNIHAWFEKRGTRLAQQVRSLYNQGCYVRILYSFMTHAIFRQLTTGTGARMSARRTIFSRGGTYATLYSHFKMIAASGHVGSDHSAHVVWTGSNNFTNSGVNFDEVMLRIASSGAFTQYRNQFAFITRRKSSAVWATFLEPRGGGRAPAGPAAKAQRATAGFAAQQQQSQGLE